MNIVISNKLRERLENSSNPLIQSLLTMSDFPEGVTKKLSYFDLAKGEDPNMLSCISEKVYNACQNKGLTFEVGSELPPPMSEENPELLDKSVLQSPEDFITSEDYLGGVLELEPGSKCVVIKPYEKNPNLIVVRFKVKEGGAGRRVKGLEGLYIQQLLAKDAFSGNGELFISPKRQDVKVGKVLRAIFTNANDSQIEEAVNSWYTLTCPAIFTVAKGPDVVNWYKKKNYGPQKDSKGKDNLGSLWGSCMNDKPSEYYEPYTMIDCCSLLLLMDCGKLLGRAFLWEIDDPNDSSKKITLMDRIYGSDKTQEKFKEEAKKKGYYFKSEQSHTNQQNWYSPEDNYKRSKKLIFRIPCDHKTFSHYPYMDTFSRAGDGNDTVAPFITNDLRFEKYSMRDTGGSRSVGSGEYVVIAGEDALEVNKRDARYIRKIKEWHKLDDVVQLHDGEWALRKDTFRVDGVGRAYKEDVVTIKDVNYLRTSDQITEYNGSFYRKDEFIASVYMNCTIPTDIAVEYEGNMFTAESLAEYKAKVESKEISPLPNPYSKLPDTWYVINPTPGKCGRAASWKNIVAYMRMESGNDFTGDAKYMGYDASDHNGGWRAFSTTSRFIEVTEASKWQQVSIEFFNKFIEYNGISTTTMIRKLNKDLKEIAEELKTAKPV